MTTFQKSFLVGGLLLGAGMCLPRVSYAGPTCNNGNLLGTYNAQITSLSFMNVLTTLNTSATTSTGTTGGAGSTGSTGTTGSGGIGSGASSGGGSTGSTGIGSTGSAGGSTGSTGSTGAAGGNTGAATVSNAGFGNTALSLGGPVAGAGRFYFDGAGNIWGRQTGTSASAGQTMVVGTYSVNNNCTASMTLTSGEHFNAVIVDQGAQALFMQNDAGSGGSIGQLTRAVEACTGPVAFPQNFGFNLFGAQNVTADTTGTTAGSTGAAATTTAAFMPYAAVGEVNLSDNGTFTLTEYIYQAGRSQSATATGTYTVSQDCNLQLTFASPASGGATGSATFQAPLTFRASLNRPNSTGRNTNASSGILSVEPKSVTTVVGTFVAQ
jgi:hypothetical protein